MLSISHQFYAMGSDCAAHLCMAPTADIEGVAGAAEAEVRRIEARYSRYRADSELTRINVAAAAGASIAVDAETAGLIAYAKACFSKTGGVFDISSGLLRAAWDFSIRRLPDQCHIDALLPRIGLDQVGLTNGTLNFSRAGMELDFGGLGKEYAADRAAEVCIGLGARHGFIDLAGDVRVIGPQPDGTPWQIGIRHPRDPAIVAAQIELTEGAIATSGDYERFIEVDGRRYCHILDPRTGWPAQGMCSVTVIAECCLVAGSLSTAAMLKGSQGAAWLAGLGVRHVAIDAAGEFYGTEPPSFTRSC
jgi:thiamine biosynthesis lipoprotein